MKNLWIGRSFIKDSQVIRDVWPSRVPMSPLFLCFPKMEVSGMPTHFLDFNSFIDIHVRIKGQRYSQYFLSHYFLILTSWTNSTSRRTSSFESWISVIRREYRSKVKVIPVLTLNSVVVVENTEKFRLNGPTLIRKGKVTKLLTLVPWCFVDLYSIEDWTKVTDTLSKPFMI